MSKRIVYFVGLMFLVTALVACGASPSVPPRSVPSPTAPAQSAAPMSLAEAKQIANQSACAQSGTLQDTAVYNSNSNTWWIDLKADKPNCNPACVVDVKMKTAEVNWRCMGVIPPTVTPQTGSQIANPASVNCTKQGGQLLIQKRGDGGEYGVCVFQDNRQCEEWALFKGECPVGGLKITGYVAPAAQYCAITGGAYTIAGNSGTPDEIGTCAFRGGQTCDSVAYYNGTCSPN